MVKSVKSSLWMLFGVALLFTVIQLSIKSPILSQISFWIYAWAPAGVALFCASQEQFRLKVFTWPNRYFYLAVLISIAISLLAFLATLPFISSISFEESLTLTTALLHYLSFLIVLSLFFLGGEIYWRGYLWEKVKENPYRAVWVIALIWSLWMIPPTLFSGASGFDNPWLNLAWMAAYNFAITPILLYFRIRGKSIFPAALFYASFQTASICFTMVFPSLLSIEGKLAYSGMSLLFLVIYAFSLKLYSRAFWERLAE